MGTIRSIISAQAVYKQTHPEAGYACDIATLVKADLLADVLATAGPSTATCSRSGATRSGHCLRPASRAFAVPARKEPGASLTVCTDETNVPRTVDGDVAACFRKGVAPK